MLNVCFCVSEEKKCMQVLTISLNKCHIRIPNTYKKIVLQNFQFLTFCQSIVLSTVDSGLSNLALKTRFKVAYYCTSRIDSAGAQNVAQYLRPTTAINFAQNLLDFLQIDAELRAGLPSQLWPHFGSSVPISLTKKSVLLEFYST